MFQSKQMGKRENKVINIEGRIQFDLLQVRGDKLDVEQQLSTLDLSIFYCGRKA